MLRYSYDGNKNDMDVFSVLQRVRAAQAARDIALEHIQSLEAFIMFYPEADRESTYFQEEMFHDLLKKAIPKGCKRLPIHVDYSKFYKFVDQAVEEMLRIANHLIAIRHARPRTTSKKLYLGVLAELMEKNINPGGNPTPFVKRCIVLFEKIIEGKQFLDCIDRHIHNIRSADWIDVYNDLEVVEVVNELRVELPADDIKTIDDFITVIPTVDSKTKSNVKRIFTCLHKRLKQKSQYTKREIHDFSKKAVTHMVKHLRHSQRSNNASSGSSSSGGPDSAGSARKEAIACEADKILSQDPMKQLPNASSSSRGRYTFEPTSKVFGKDEKCKPFKAEKEEHVQEDFLIIPVSVVDSELSHTDLIYSPYVLHSPSASATDPASAGAGTEVKVEQSDSVSVSVSASDSIVTFHNEHQYYQVQFYQDETGTASAAAVADTRSGNSDGKGPDIGSNYRFDLELDEDFCDYWEDDETIDDEHIAALLREEEQDKALKKNLDGQYREQTTSSNIVDGGVVTCENGVDLSIATPISYSEEAAYCSSAVVTAEAVSPVSPIIVASSPLDGESGKKKKNKVGKAFDDMNRAFKKIGI